MTKEEEITYYQTIVNSAKEALKTKEKGTSAYVLIESSLKINEGKLMKLKSK